MINTTAVDRQQSAEAFLTTEQALASPSYETSNVEEQGIIIITELEESMGLFITCAKPETVLRRYQRST